MNSEIKVVVSVLVITAIIIIGGLSLTKGGPKTNEVQINPSLVTSSSTIFYGSPSAVVNIVEFGDFACPACAQLSPNLEAVLADPAYRDKVAVGIRLLPIHGKESINSAIAAYSAAEQGKFHEYGKMLFEKQNEWVGKSNQKELFISYATALGLDVAKFTADLNSKEMDDRVNDIIDKDNTDALTMKIQSTPTVIFNGRLAVVGVQTVASLKEYIDVQLRNEGVAPVTTIGTSTASTTIGQ